MNWLAHIFLSEQNIDFQIANYLADPLKGKVWDSANENIIKGMKTHLLIDTFTDNNHIVQISKERLRNTGLLKAIIIDITYDYFLTKNWNNYCNTPYLTFTENFYGGATKRLEYLSPKAKTSLSRLIKYRILNNYQSIEHLKIAFERLDKRLSKRLISRDSASSYFEAVEENINDLENDFLEFFPQLCKEIKKNVNPEKLKHWKI